jgi:hypothetical protein
MLRYSAGRVGIGYPLRKEIPELTLLSHLTQMDKVQINQYLKYSVTNHVQFLYITAVLDRQTVTPRQQAAIVRNVPFCG